MTESNLQQHYSLLKETIGQMGHVLVAFSGGVDSALVLKVAHDVLGGKAVALTAISPTFPPEEQEISVTFTQSRDIQHILVNSNELEDEGYAKNKGDRCYFCKSELFKLARQKASDLGIPWVLDGTIVDDLGEHRPGLVAASEKSIRHPLVEAKLNKEMVRKLAKQLGIHVWNKPSFACLGSRFPVGTRVTLKRVGQVQRVESALRTFGFKQFRARWHSIDGAAMVRIELSSTEMEKMLNYQVREAMIEICKAEGFQWVTMDLIGYQKGSLSEATAVETDLQIPQ
jgi:pyridinium-3,5-biscarboxylic acid mononucleotide sulfurtransferase